MGERQLRYSILDRISYHAVYDNSILEALKWAHINGFKGVQVADESPHLSFERLTSAEVRSLRTHIENRNMTLSIHVPDSTISLFQCSGYLSGGMKDYFRALFAFSRNVKVKLVTLHPGSLTTFRTDSNHIKTFPEEDLQLYLDAARRNLETIARLADNNPVLCIENHKLDDLTMSLLEPFLKNGAVSLCWDLAKSQKNPDSESFLLSNLHHVKQVHLHDIRKVDGKKRSHQMVGSGEVDFKRYLGHLSQVDVLDYCIEVRPREQALESLVALRKILNEIESGAEHADRGISR